MRRWSQEEIELLAKEYPLRGSLSFRLLDRTQNAVNLKANDLGLRTSHRGPSNLVALLPWSDVERAYIAGIIDGEGTITFQGNDRTRGVVTRISVANTDKGLMDYLAVMFGAPVHVRRIPARGEKWRDQYDLTVFYERAFQIAVLVRPYLRVKANQADLLMEFHEWRKQLGYRGGSRPYSIEERAKRDEMVEKMLVLNKRGRRVLA